MHRHPTRLSKAAADLRALSNAIEHQYEYEEYGESTADSKHASALDSVKAELVEELREDDDVGGVPMWKEEIFDAFAQIELARIALLSQQLFDGRDVISLTSAIRNALGVAATALDLAEEDTPLKLPEGK